MATPTFANLDIGLDGGALHTAGQANSLCSVEVGTVQVARSTFAFAGFAAQFKSNMGPQSRLVVWAVVLRADTLATLNAIETEIDDLVKGGGTGTLADTQGRAHESAMARDYQGQRGYDVIHTGALAGWVRKTGRITFEVLTP